MRSAGAVRAVIGRRFLTQSSPNRFERECNPLPPAYAKRHQATADAVASHRMQKPGGQHRPRGADRVSMRYCAALDVHNLLR